MEEHKLEFEVKLQILSSQKMGKIYKLFEPFGMHESKDKWKVRMTMKTMQKVWKNIQISQHKRVIYQMGNIQ